MDNAVKDLVDSWGYPLLFVLVGLESLGVPVPGETALLAAAAWAALGHFSITAVVAVAVAAAVLGDNAGYWIGRTGGVALVRRYGRVIHLNESYLERGHRFFERYGPKAVFFGRFIALLRTWAAVLTGTTSMPYGTFMLYNALGAVCWAVLTGTLGYLFGHNLPQLEQALTRVSLAAVVIVLAMAGLVAWWAWLRRAAVARFESACGDRKDGAVRRPQALDTPSTFQGST